MSHNYYDNEAMVKCTDNGKEVTANVIDFRPQVYLTVNVNTVSVNLQYVTKFNHYVGSMAGMEFISSGPKLLG